MYMLRRNRPCLNEIDVHWTLGQSSNQASSRHEPLSFGVVSRTPKEPVNKEYRQLSNIIRTLVGNTIVDHLDVVGASPVGAAPTASSFSTQHLATIGSDKRNRKTKRGTFKVWDLVRLILEVWRYFASSSLPWVFNEISNGHTRGLHTVRKGISFLWSLAYLAMPWHTDEWLFFCNWNVTKWSSVSKFCGSIKIQWDGSCDAQHNAIPPLTHDTYRHTDLNT